MINLKNKWVFPGMLAFSCMVAVGCGSDESEPVVPPANNNNTNNNNNTTPGNIAEVATEAGFSTLVSAAETAGLVGALTGTDKLTVFAPTNDAFAALGDAVPSDAGLLANVLLHHVVAGEQKSGDVLAAGEFTTLANTSLKFDASGSPIKVNGFNLSSTLDVAASNGVIHILDQVIVPPTILETAAATADLSTLVSAVGASSQGIKDALAAGGPMTVFAPINSAFAKIDGNALTALLENTPELDMLLKYHVVPSQVLAGDLTDGQEVETLAGKKLTVGIGNDGATLTDESGQTIKIVATDIRLLNGTVHLIDTVIMPKAKDPLKNIVDTASDAGLFSTLLSAATNAGLADTLSTGGPFTVFAPTDAAFTALGVDLTPVDVNVITNILLHHVVGRSMKSDEVLGTNDLSSLANLGLAVSNENNQVSVGGAQLSATMDVAASNGIIHIMDEVIVPPTIVEVASATADLSTLVDAIGKASTAIQGAVTPNTLAGDSPITVFAPTNAAFAATGLDLNALDQATLDGVLAHHVISSQAMSSDLSDGMTVNAANGSLTIEIDSNTGAVTVVDGKGGRANVVATLKDIRTLTGVVHVIDAVLMP
ncbi:MAG: fasciclin domain-containing protein [Myxococcota bacterium]|nr:fasciclin domain-containing protein [Myxococcota bacterium]